MNEHSIIMTEDGSMTIFNKEKNEHFHSIHGAVQESIHVFINNGLKNITGNGKGTELPVPMLNILEIGFGTGLNALLTLMEFLSDGNKPLSINYTGLEPNPIDLKVATQLNYCDHLNCESLHDAFIQMHKGEPGKMVSLVNGFTFTKEYVTFQQYLSNDQVFNLVYFDAFSPVTEPDLWTDAVFKKLFTIMNDGGVLVTYCSKGSVRRSMQQQSFKIERLPGPPGKHEMLRATKMQLTGTGGT